MICKSNVYSGTQVQNKNWQNWSGRVNFHANKFFSPGAPHLENLVHVIALATGGNDKLHAIGSAWAYEDIAKSDSWVIDCSNMQGQLTTIVGPQSNGLTPAWRARQSDPNASTHLVHVEAGMEVGMLAQTLDGMGWAMPTLGGANGQTIAGALSTSTHGGDWEQPPLPDAVRAIHLVAHGGQELWIERASEPITQDALLQPLLPCSGTKIVRSDEIFDAAIVSFGRFGVIYSFVLEVRRAFNVVEVVTQVSRASVMQALRQSRVSFDPLFSLLVATPPPAGLAEHNVISNAANKPYFWQLAFNSLDPDDLFVQRRWITNNSTDLNIPARNCTPGWLIATGVNVVGWVTHTVNHMVHAGMWSNFADAVNQGRRGPHWLLTSGTRDASHNQTYRADSIEVVFSAADPAYLDFLDTIQQAGRGLKQAGYISLRPSRTSRATLSMHNVVGEYAISIEVASLLGMPDNAAWMQLVEREAVARGGRPHWGQINTLTDAQMEVLYGQQRRNWCLALQRVSGSSTLFSNNFTRQRGMEPALPVKHVTAVSQALDELMVFQLAHQDPQNLENGLIEYSQWSSPAGWSARQGLRDTLSSQGTALDAVVVNGEVYVFGIMHNGWVCQIHRGSNGVWSLWWPPGKSNEPYWNGVACGAVHGVSCQSHKLDIFYTNKRGRVIFSSWDTRGLLGGPSNTGHVDRVPGARFTVPGGHVTAVSRRQGQIDIFMVDQDGKVVTAAWNAAQGWNGWWDVDGLRARPGSYIGTVSRSQDQLDIFAVAQDGKVVSASWNPQQNRWLNLGQISQGVSTSGSIAVVSRSTDLIDIFTVGQAQQIITASWSPTARWSNWGNVTSAKAQSAISAVSRSSNKLDIFFIAPSGKLQTAAWQPGHSWGGPWDIR